jgi:hydantoinase/carbamoylase family amidase
MNLGRLEKTLKEINGICSSDKGVTRLAYTAIERNTVEAFANLCRQEGMTIRTDFCGNLIARRAGRNPMLPAVASGSHLDTVIHGGQFDGAVGIAAALEVVRSFNEKGIETEHPIEIICFACEESARFGVSTIGSKAMAGELKKKSVGTLKDNQGVTFQEAFSDCSLDFDKVDQCARTKDDLKAFIEVHIEQGPVLEAHQTQIGIVYAIAAPTRFQVHIQGKASHSGATPMNLRKDALLGAAEIAIDLELAAKAESANGTVATIGVFDVQPGAMNVIPDYVDMKIDIRGTSAESKAMVIDQLYAAFERVQKTRGLTIEWALLSEDQPIQLDPDMIRSLALSCDRMGITYGIMPSGAGHDSMNMAKLCPTGLIFVPSKDGLSHHPDEFTPIEAIGIGAMLLEEEMMKLAGASVNEKTSLRESWSNIS